MYNTILVPIEPSLKRSGINAIKIAKKLINNGGDIILVSVLEHIPTYVEVQLPKPVQDNVRKQALAELKNIARENGFGLNVEVMSGHAANSILEVAETHSADLIIIASHKPGLSDYFLGSTAA